MHPLVEKLIQKYEFNPADLPVLVALLEMGARAVPSEKDRPARRRIQMRMLRQWERLEDALVDFLADEATDDDLCAVGERELEPFYLQNSGWLAPGTDPEQLRSAITKVIRLATAHKLKENSTMKAPLHLEEEFNMVVNSVDACSTTLDRFLRGSLRASNACVQLVQQIEEYIADGGDFPSTAPLEEAKAALLAQGFTH